MTNSCCEHCRHSVRAQSEFLPKALFVCAVLLCLSRKFGSFIFSVFHLQACFDDCRVLGKVVHRIFHKRSITMKNNIFILTGAPGSGKSTVLARLAEQGVLCVPEPARQIISEQRAIGGEGVFDRNSGLFVELLLSRSIAQYKAIDSSQPMVVFDRGVADNIAYAFKQGWEAARQYRANQRVFFAPNWRDIYVTDGERTMSFAESAAMGDALRRIYVTLGYNVVDLPLANVEERVRFMLEKCDRDNLS